MAVMRYVYKVKSIDDFDLKLLGRQIQEAGLPLGGLHAGCGSLVMAMSAVLDRTEKLLLDSVIRDHAPVWFSWTDEDGQMRKDKVSSVEDVDRITGMRIRNSVGGHDPVQEQMKLLRLAVWAQDVQLNPTEYSAVEKTRAAQIRQTVLNAHNRIEAIRQEGKSFKTSHGW